MVDMPLNSTKFLLIICFADLRLSRIKDELTRKSDDVKGFTQISVKQIANECKGKRKRSGWDWIGQIVKKIINPSSNNRWLQMRESEEFQTGDYKKYQRKLINELKKRYRRLLWFISNTGFKFLSLLPAHQLYDLPTWEGSDDSTCKWRSPLASHVKSFKTGNIPQRLHRS